MVRIAMVNHCGVVSMFAVIIFTPLLLGVVESSSITDLDGNVPMLTLDEMLFHSRPRERKLATALVWCVAKSNLSDAALQGALDWVCGPLPSQGQVNCGPVQSGQSCFLPDTVPNHASWAFNVYFQTHNATDDACDFQGTAMQVTVDPSSSTCVFQATSKEVNGTISNGTIIPSPPGTALNAAPIGFEPQYLLHVTTAVMLMTYLLT